MTISISLESVELGATRNHLIFKGYVPHLGNQRYTFDFIGTEVITSCSITDAKIKKLKEKLVKDFGYAPFDEDEAIQELGNRKFYCI